jgi:hypothetical protein
MVPIELIIGPGLLNEIPEIKRRQFTVRPLDQCL